MYTRTAEIMFEMYTDLVNPETVKFNYRNHMIIAGGVAYAHSEFNETQDQYLHQEKSKLHPLLASEMRELGIKHANWYPYSIFKAFLYKVAKEGNFTLNPQFLFPKIVKRTLKLSDLTKSQFWQISGNTEKVGCRLVHALCKFSCTFRETGEDYSRNWEERTLFHFLQNCSEAALLLPEHLTLEYARILKIAGN